MQELTWLKSHIGSLEDGTELINKFYWHLTINEKDGTWFVKGGEKVIFRADSRESVDSFIYGMALAYSIIPETLVEQFREEFKVE